MTAHELIARNAGLPASRIAEAVNATLAEHDAVVVVAPPGAGKSTLLPLTINAALQGKGKVLMLEPRRIAARQIAERMAFLLGETVGNTVGYRIRFEKKVSENTQIEVLTEGILTRMLVADPTLDGVTAVIFDEFHERSLNSDLALTLTRLTQQVIRPDLKIIIMSATIDADEICRSLKAPKIESEGCMFPVQVIHSAEDANLFDLPAIVARTIAEAHRKHEGDILAFMPGQAEIIKCAELLGNGLGKTAIYPLYGNLSPEQQRRAIAQSKLGERKVVIATPIAETSLTIEGVRIVIDTGFCRSLIVDQRTGLSHLQTVRISMDMATQRTGRAGRVAEGTCYRLWTTATESRMSLQRKPEIVEADLANLLLDVAVFGEKDIESLPWLTPPPSNNVQQARKLLMLLGPFDENCEITTLGKAMSVLPCHPRIAKMILQAKTAEEKALACDIAALLEEKDPLAEDSQADLTLRISALRKSRKNKNIGRWMRIAQIANEYRTMAYVDEDNSEPIPHDIGALIAAAYPERIAMAIDAIGHFRLANGDNVQLDKTDPLSSQPWLAIASLHAEKGTQGRVFLAAPISSSDLETLASERENISWDSKRGCIVQQKERRIGKLLLGSTPIQNASRERVISIICEAVSKEGLSILNWDDEVSQLQRRLTQAAQWHPEIGFPDLSTEHLLATPSEWLPYILEQDNKLKTSTEELKKINLAKALLTLIPYEQQQQLERIAPTHIVVPTGSHIRIDYRQGSDIPVLSVRLQECFGLTDTPRINEGCQPVLMELLSPGFKPVQLTQDLKSFWENTYFEVRKELKRRYPKHYWPENPLEAEAVRGVKKSNS
ncbi:MAG: ATP-dependent helicase HrpB [Bacteroidales bacterium]|nr:ATP-dependent helicase HrpB [Bacteroidales bacterium]